MAGLTPEADRRSFPCTKRLRPAPHFIRTIYNAALYRAFVSVRQFILSLVALVAIGHANLTTDLTGRKPNASGITQLGRDMVRRNTIDA